MPEQQFALGSVIDHGGAEYAVTAQGYISLMTGMRLNQLTLSTRLIRRPFGLPIEEKN